MKPWDHAKNSAVKFGGKPKDYIKIHDRMDSSKSAEATNKHRCIFHSAFGIYIIEELFGHTITNSAGTDINVRDIAEQHVLEDLGFIPSLSDWLKHMPDEPWMIRPAVREAVLPTIFIQPTQPPEYPYIDGAPGDPNFIKIMD